MPVTVAAIAKAVGTIIPLIKQIYDQTKSYQKNFKEIEDLVKRINRIASCIAILNKRNSLKDVELESLKDESLEDLDTLLRAALNIVTDFSKQSKASQFVFAGSIRDSIISIHAKFADSEKDFDLLFSTRSWKVDESILQFLNDIKETTGAGLDVGKKTLDKVTDGFAAQEERDAKLLQAVIAESAQKGREREIEQDTTVKGGVDSSEIVARRDEAIVASYKEAYSRYYDLYRKDFPTMDFDSFDAKVYQSVVRELEHEEKLQSKLIEYEKMLTAGLRISQKVVIEGTLKQSKIIAEHRQRFRESHRSEPSSQSAALAQSVAALTTTGSGATFSTPKQQGSSSLKSETTPGLS